MTSSGSLAKELSVWLLIGSLSIKLLDEPRVANRSYLIAPTGSVVTSYDKVHMFDATLAGGEVYRESAKCRPGTSLKVASLPWGKIGLSVCYDVRFPHLYRALAQAGAVFLSVPAAFTRPTGAAHWETLLRARAIENGCYVFAPAQCGEHPGGRRTYGYSLIVDPWGRVLADGGEEPGIVCADVDVAAVAEARAAVPSLQHDRPFTVEEV